eukprot:gi/632991820/ref/XP_007884799.1/ PREDICTED: serine/threonine-protein kinase 36-like [Callorhinchus milii]
MWNNLWQRVSLVLGFTSERPVMEGETPRPNRPTPPPDWDILSPQGALLFLELSLAVFTRAPDVCLSLLTSPFGCVTHTLTALLSPQFLSHLRGRLALDLGDGENVLDCLLVAVCEIFCFPFAVDSDHSTYSEILKTYEEIGLVTLLLQVSERE